MIFYIPWQVSKLNLEGNTDTLEVYSGGRTLDKSQLIYKFRAPVSKDIEIPGIDNFFILRLNSPYYNNSSVKSFNVEWKKGALPSIL